MSLALLIAIAAIVWFVAAVTLIYIDSRALRQVHANQMLVLVELVTVALLIFAGILALRGV